MIDDVTFGAYLLCECTIAFDEDELNVLLIQISRVQQSANFKDCLR